jgi:hypothetical protein
MLRYLFIAFLVFGVASCGGRVAEFWRPISEPNLQMPLERAQIKLDFDLSQCRCGIFPTNIAHNDMLEFQPDKQRLAETSITTTADDASDPTTCVRRPSLVVAECMRGRGWEVTNCSGRMPLAGGAAMCAGFVPDDEQ